MAAATRHVIIFQVVAQVEENLKKNSIDDFKNGLSNVQCCQKYHYTHYTNMVADEPEVTLYQVPIKEVPIVVEEISPNIVDKGLYLLYLISSMNRLHVDR